MDLKRKFTPINETVRRSLNITRDEYAFCSYVLYRQADQRQKLRGWCCDTKDQIAYFVGISRAGIYKMTDRMVCAGLLEVDATTGFLCATSYFMDIENECKLSLQNEFEQKQDNVNLVYTDCKLSLHENEKSVNLVTPNIRIERVNKKDKERVNQIAVKEAEPETKSEKPNFAKLPLNDQLRAVYVYAKGKLSSVDALKVSQDEKNEKRGKYTSVVIALNSDEFRAVLSDYKEYRKTNKGIKPAKKWYDSEITLCGMVAELAILAGINGSSINMPNVRRIFDYTVEKGYTGFYLPPSLKASNPAHAKNDIPAASSNKTPYQFGAEI